MFNKNFYPTPKDLASKMFFKLENATYLTVFLEPSAGKGDILDYVKSVGSYNYGKTDSRTFHAIEIEPELKDILYGKGYTVVADDFLTFKTYKRYEAILMNPPFDNGEKHLLKALELIQDGGQVVCILNHETLANPFTNDRKRLTELLTKYNATVENIGKPFMSAERKTAVECVMVYVYIKPQPLENDIYKNIRFSVESEFAEEYKTGGNELVKYDEVKQLVQDYRTECELYLTAQRAASALTSFTSVRKKENEHCNSFVVRTETSGMWDREADYLKDIRVKYWGRVLSLETFKKYLTNKAINTLREKIEKQAEIEINVKNIMEIKAALMGVFVDNLEQAAVNAFEEVTKYHQAEYSGNVHYYSGWKTNQAAYINKKIIIPSWTRKDEFVEELAKVLNYFDGFKEYTKPVLQHRKDLDAPTCEYFEFKTFLKGTMHIWFTRLDLLDRFNLFVGQKKNWIPQHADKQTRRKVQKDVCQHYKEDDEIDYQINVSGQLLLGNSKENI